MPQPGIWGLAWTFNCPARSRPDFSVAGITSGPGKAKNDKSLKIGMSGPAGHGITWTTHDAGDHSLTVASNCSWRIAVVLPKPVSTQTLPNRQT